MSELTHFNQQGNAHMVDVGDKAITQRKAIAEGLILMQTQTLETILQGSHKKGDVLGIARIAGIMAAKKTADLIPLCHPLALSHIDITLEAKKTGQWQGIICQATVTTQGQTGVEMEALTAVNISLLTIYDMCKAIDRGMCMRYIKLVHKSGGKSGSWDI